MRTLLIDMDSVICDLMTEWHRRYNEQYDDDLCVAKLQCWQTEKYVKPECGMKVYDFLDEPGLFLNLLPLPDAVEVLERLSHAYEILLVTSSRTHAYTEKEQWVERRLPFIGKHNLIFAHRKEMIRGDLLFDDAPHNLLSFQSSGREVVAMDYPYNRAVSVPRVSSWLEFETLLMRKWGARG
ncbi:5' nucleotidase, NT5C type [Tumebacillus permanentifrigoris]|uniref:5'(3')-deoxyribonucleotidase n=1 Tax=Tumebacillus permanentifrigoris TaxID=378543 RepID=A0A316DBC3_9BACL|nr:5'(3')-deoxyribonucleotidase [Tumebacillus permanentifrigoris]PWK11334.1 5'(3')-deoxyribonucleotidase [Tumebacillus permanentifrigoris]